MPDDISPEERLLRLIKEGSAPDDKGKASSGDKSVEMSGENRSKKTINEKSVDKKTVKKVVISPKSSQKVTKSDVSKENPESDSKTKKKPRVQGVDKSKQPVLDKLMTEKNDKLVQKSPKKSAKVSKEQTTLPKQPVGQTVPNGEEDKPRKSFNFVDQVNWFFSGFNFFNYLLLGVFICVLFFSIWHIYRAPKLEADLPEIVSVESTDQSQTDSVGPVAKPFPYYIEQIGRKKLFKLIAPPPPPKPRVPARREKKKPKVDIEKKTRHLVLQGIVYDIGPPQAIIFNKKENKTIFAGNNTMIGDIKVKEIKRGKIILEFEGQTQEMSF